DGATEQEVTGLAGQAKDEDSAKEHRFLDMLTFWKKPIHRISLSEAKAVLQDGREVPALSQTSHDMETANANYNPITDRFPFHSFGTSFFHLNCPFMHLSDTPGGSGRDGPFRFTLPTDGDEGLFTVFSEYFLGLYHSDGLDTIEDLVNNGKLLEEEPDIAGPRQENTRLRPPTGEDGFESENNAELLQTDSDKDNPAESENTTQERDKETDDTTTTPASTSDVEQKPLRSKDLQHLEVHYSLLQDRYVGRYQMSLAALGEDHLRQMDAATLRQLWERDHVDRPSQEPGGCTHAQVVGDRLVGERWSEHQADTEIKSSLRDHDAPLEADFDTVERTGAQRDELPAEIKNEMELQDNMKAAILAYSKSRKIISAPDKTTLDTVSGKQIKELYEFLLLGAPPGRKLLPRLVKPFLQHRCRVAKDFSTVEEFVRSRPHLTTEIGLDAVKHRSTLTDLATHIRPCAFDYLESLLLQNQKCVNFRQLFHTVDWS
ncbi:unnamed protein product, partial [Amoebophrya sp. A120]